MSPLLDGANIFNSSFQQFLLGLASNVVKFTLNASRFPLLAEFFLLAFWVLFISRFYYSSSLKITVSLKEDQMLAYSSSSAFVIYFCFQFSARAANCKLI